jgi:hypothetical protein
MVEGAMSTEATETKTLAAYIAVKKDPAQVIRDNYKKSKDAMSKHRDQWREIYRLCHGYVQEKFKKLRRANIHFHKILIS